ncbi:MAG TPA: prolyl oligopeptidase family serine peptidase, partial [Caulobacteraceae bacterium]
MLRTLGLAAALALALPMTAHAQTAAPAPAAAAPASSDDPFLWLEEAESPRALEWVAERNRRSLAVLQGDARYQAFYTRTLERLQAADRIPSPSFSRGAAIDNFWQDATHVRGVWRRTTLDSYRTAEPRWETVLDVDALAAAESANWVYKGAACLAPQERRCLVVLSDGGKDANRVREYDAEARAFVEGGFDLPESKGGSTWINDDEILVWRDFGEGSLTRAGYPSVIKRLRRGQSMDQAEEIFRGQNNDIRSVAYTLRDPDGRLRATIVQRDLTYYDVEYHALTERGLVRMALPQDTDVQGLLGDRLIFTTNRDWTSPSGQAFVSGDVVSVDLDAFIADPASAQVELVLRPGQRDAVQSVNFTRNTMVVAMTENVRGAAYVLRPGADGWSRTRLPLPENVTVGLGSASDEDDRVFLTVAGYLTPSTLWLADAATGEAEAIKQLPPKFDATGLVVEQFEARSADGTMIPYFVVHRADMPLDGSTPTVLYGYGGFGSSQLPGYSSSIGDLWLRNGGAWVVANIRGGGEFGPHWHQAALTEHRHRAHDDFLAVAQDLIARRITSPRRLGMMGGSQGGLLVGAALTQRPELFNAAVIQVPLFDMLRYTRIGAGASWRSE